MPPESTVNKLAIVEYTLYQKKKLHPRHDLKHFLYIQHKMHSHGKYEYLVENLSRK
jgi:hypothetical protein